MRSMNGGVEGKSRLRSGDGAVEYRKFRVGEDNIQHRLK